MKQRIWKKMLCVFLAVILIVGAVPATAFAAQGGSGEAEAVSEVTEVSESISEETMAGEELQEEFKVGESSEVIEEETVQEKPEENGEAETQKETGEVPEDVSEEVTEDVSEDAMEETGKIFGEEAGEEIEIQAVNRTVIKEARFEVEEPAGGRKVSYEARSLTKGCRVYVESKYTDVYGGVKWYDETAEEVLTEGDSFITGHEYTVRIYAIVDNPVYYEFDVTSVDGEGQVSIKPNVDTTINGNDAYSITLGNKTPKTAYIAKYTFPACNEAPQDITQVGVENLEYPIEGNPVDFNVTLSGVGYTFSYGTESHYTNGLLWYDATANRYVEEGDRYKAGHEYWLLIPIERKKPYQFAVGDDGKSSMAVASPADNTYLMNPYEPGEPQKRMEIHCEFYCCKESIKLVELEGIHAPKEGDKPDYYAIAVNTEQYDIPRESLSPITWYEDGQIMGANNEFRSGCSYGVAIEVYAKEGNVFATDEDWNPTVLGILDEKETVVRKAWEQSSDEMIELYYDFGECPDSLIGEVTITGLEYPIPGALPEYTAEAEKAEYYIPNNNGYDESYENGKWVKYYHKKNGVRWYDQTAERFIYSNEPFIAGHDYKVFIDLKVSNEEDYRFDLGENNQSHVDVNIKDEYDTYLAVQAKAVSGTSNPMWNHSIEVSFPWKLPEVIAVRVFDIELPMAGKHPDFMGEVERQELYGIDTITWINEEGSYMAQEDVFEAGQNYTLEVCLSAVEFDKDYACKFNKERFNAQINGSCYGDIPNQEIEAIFSQGEESVILRAVYTCKKESEFIPVEEISFSTDYLNVKSGSVGNVELYIYPENATDKEIVFTSSDPAVFGIDGSAGKEGVAVITATTRDGSKSASVLVCVTKDGSGYPKGVAEVLAAMKKVAVVDENNYKEEIADVIRARELLDAADNETKFFFTYYENNTDSYIGKIYNKFWDSEIYYEGLGLWSSDIPNQNYNGKALKPDFEVYHGLVLLKEGKDYTVSYKNNTNAAQSNAFDAKGKSIAPTAVIKGKGNFEGTLEKTFTILPINLDEYKTSKELQKILEISPITVKWSGKMIKSVPTVKVSGKSIGVSAKQYTLLYEEPAAGAYTDAGTWKITINGSGKNFTGSTTVSQIISPRLISKVNIILDKASYPYNDATGVTYPGSVLVRDGKTDLYQGIDYSITYENCGKIGTATVKITGMGNYSGTKTKTYKITGIALKANMVKQLNDFTYDGTQKSVEEGYNYTISDQGVPLIKNVDYTVTYSGDRVNAGKLKVNFKGINRYSGSVTKTYTIAKAPVTDMQITLKGADKVSYVKDGATPKPNVYFNGNLMIEGKDYKVSYANNKKMVSKEDAKAPYLYISGIGNFTGNTKNNPVKYSIIGSPIKLNATMTVSDLLYKDAKNNYVPSITLTDKRNGKKLVKKTDYSASYTYEVWDESLGDYRTLTEGRVTETDFSGNRIQMRVTVAGVNNYSGEISKEYEIYRKNISTVKVEKIEDQNYTGKQLTPEVRVSVKVKEGNKDVYYPLDSWNYDLVYENNINKGTATVYIHGRGEYGGVKKVTFKITGQKMKWWNIWEN